MAEETTTANPQAGAASDTSSQPQAGTPDPQAGDGSTETISLADAKKLRSEAVNLRQRLKESESLLADLKTFKEQTEASQLTETEKRDRANQQREQQFAALQKERDTLAQRVQDVLTNSAIQLHAIQQGIDPKLAQRLLDQTQLERDEAGEPKNLDAVFKAMIKEFNLSVGGKPVSTAGGATSPARSQSSAPQALSWDVIGHMKPEEYAARAPEIQAWIAANPIRFGQRR